MKLNATYSVIGAVVAEFVGSDCGLGFGMLQATYNLNTPRLYGYLVVSCGLGVLMYGAVVLAEYLCVRRG
jgi:NitT/TauT family transport system permease protein